jgi:nucleotide-binding universal stress UspA family protein
VDESEQSKWAVQAGGRLAGERAASIILVHVVPFPTLPGVSTMGSHDGNQVLEAAREPLPQSLEITELLRSGDPPDEILAAAHEWHADLIIMGTHGRGRLAAFLLGSTADSVIRRARCPVLTIAHQPASEFWGEPIQTESTRQPSLTVASA